MPEHPDKENWEEVNMTVYRLTYQVNSERNIPASALHSIWEEGMKYLHTVVLPDDSPAGGTTKILDYDELNDNAYPVHRHRGSDGCSECNHMVSDNHQ